MSLFQKLVRYGTYPLSLWKLGEGVQLRYLREFERTQHLPTDEIRELQWQRLLPLLQHAYRHCGFYRERFNRAGIVPGDIRCLADLAAVPVLEKRDIQEERDRMVARDWPRDDLLPNFTGGSTGTPLSFFLSKERKCARAAATIRHNRWAGWDVGDKVAVLWGAPPDLPKPTLRNRLRNFFLERQIILDTGRLTEESMLAFHRQLFRYRPKVILAYAQSAALFARFLQDQNLVPYRPHSIVTSAEILEPENRLLIEQVFGCKVFNRYGCREVSVIASECEMHQGLHVMAEGLYLEIVKDGRPARTGELGSILVTDLLNYAMPMIRYRIGDLGSWERGMCACGRGLPRLHNVAGRMTDFVVGADGRLVSGVFISTYLIGKRPSLGQVQITQTVPGKVRFLIRPGAAFRKPDDLDWLERSARQYLGEETEVEYEFVEELKSEPSGKFLFCRSAAGLDYWQSATGKEAA